MRITPEDLTAACHMEAGDLLALLVETHGTAVADRLIFEAGRVANGERRPPTFKEGAVRVVWPRWR